MAGYIILPLYDTETFSYSISLAGVKYKFTFTWNSRQGRYHFDITSEGNSPILLGTALVANVFDGYTWDDSGSYLVCIPLTRLASEEQVPQSQVKDQYSLVFFDRS